MELITFIQRVKDKRGATSDHIDYLRVGAYINDFSNSENLTFAADLGRRGITFKVVNSPAIRNLPKDVDAIRYDGVLWGITNKDRGRRTARYVTLTAEQAA